jgi:GR25 family glycosyltransferase involved in LPS biosynthesis
MAVTSIKKYLIHKLMVEYLITRCAAKTFETLAFDMGKAERKSKQGG